MYIPDTCNNLLLVLLWKGDESRKMCKHVTHTTYCLDWTLVWWNCLDLPSTNFSECSVPPHDMSLAWDRLTTSHWRWSSYIGCLSNTESDTNSVSRCTWCTSTHHHSISPIASPQSRGAVFGLGIWPSTSVSNLAPDLGLASVASGLLVLIPRTAYLCIFISSMALLFFNVNLKPDILDQRRPVTINILLLLLADSVQRCLINFVCNVLLNVVVWWHV